MHVCMLTAGTFPSDERLTRTGAALRAGGHAVTVCARGTGGPTGAIVDGIDVRRLPDDDLYSGPKGILDGARYALSYVQPAWLRAASEIDDERSIDVCCVADLDLLKTGLKVGSKLGVPVVADLPSAPAATTPAESVRGGRLRQYARRVFHSPWRRDRTLGKRIPDVDRLVTTCEEARAEYVREREIDPERVAVVRNTVEPDLAAGTEPADGFGFDHEAAFVVTVAADGVSQESLETVVVAAARAADRAADLRVLIVGDLEEAALDDLERLARRRLAAGRVSFRTEDGKLASYLTASDVCVLPERSQATETTVPRAFFTALAFGVPVVAGETPPLKRLLERTGAGLCVRHGTGALAGALSELAGPDRRGELATNAQLAAEGAFDSERDADRLCELYESLLATPEPDVTVPRADS
ncbi:glycosyltransferase [Halococcus thailandensis]|uniref:Glycosyltransferase n=1 Tax=Halococcus thailandensis JCM 13552 TaxID=1227457 RepID=M0MYQ1_9EURY|nr:glycosyltransferase [Halococcus thailandensis]EMA49510.1 glycosyltransferase [Halococcus thailandensis JCM 13552]